MSILGSLRRLSQPTRRVSIAVHGWAAFWASRLPQVTTILSNTCGDNTAEQLGPRIALFCHFDGKGRIRDHTRAYIDALCAQGLDLVFVTNSPTLRPMDIEWIKARAARVMVRRNVGYDFAAWRDAMAANGLPNTTTRLLLIVNDSVYGPLHPLAPILERIDFGAADVWSATDSWQHAFHLQTFFVAFGPTALQHEAFARFWRSVGNVRSKWWVVQRYEIGLSQVLIAAGLSCRALWRYTDIMQAIREAAAQENGIANQTTEPLGPAAALYEPFGQTVQASTDRILLAAVRRSPLNPTADLWRMLIERGCPFLKRELLRDNPSRVPDIALWSTLVARIDESSHALILGDLESILKNRTP